MLHKCTKNHDHICYTVPEAWCVTDVIVIFDFGLFLALLPPKNSKFHKNEKMAECIIILHICTKNYDLMMYGS